MDAILKGNLKLIPINEAIRVFRTDYAKMKDMFFGKIPEYDEMLESIKSKESLINEKIKEFLKIKN